MIFYFKITEALKGLARAPLVFKFLGEDIVLGLKIAKLTIKNYIFVRKLKHNLGCKLSTIKDFYKHVGLFHLEIPANNGIFINNTIKLNDIYPLVTVVDTDKESFDSLDMYLEQCLCKAHLINLDITKEKIEVDIKLDSIALQFALETLPGGITQIDSFLSNLKEILHEKDSIVFGTTVVGNTNDSDIKHSKKALKYIKKMNDSKIWYNQNTSLNELIEIFKKYFPNISLKYEGSCLFFLLQSEQKKLNAKKLLPEDDPLMVSII